MQIGHCFQPTRSKVWLAAFILAQAVLFTLKYTSIDSNPLYSQFKSITGAGFPLAKASAASISLSTSLILFPVCRNIINRIRNSFVGKLVPFEAVVGFHRVIGLSISVFSIIHIAAHLSNLRLTSIDSGENATIAIWSNMTNLTGVLLVVVLFLLTTSSTRRIRQTNHEIFFYTHHLYSVCGIMLLDVTVRYSLVCYCCMGLFVIFVKTLVNAKGTYSFNPFTYSPRFWIYLLPSLITYTIERVLKESSFNHHTQIQKIIGHPSSVLEIQILKHGSIMQPGQHILLNCPEISLGQWHAFTVTSAPEEMYISVHMRCSGDWTMALAERVGCRWDANGGVVAGKSVVGMNAKLALPEIIIDGPFGTSYEDVFKFSTVALFGAGIGVTPFASLLKHIWHRMKHNRPTAEQKLQRVYLNWICRDKQSFEWFQSLLCMIEDDTRFSGLLVIQVYVTGKLSESERINIALNERVGGEANDRGRRRRDREIVRDPVTRLMAKTNYGRPDFQRVFGDLMRVHRGETVGVFFCGPKAVEGAVRDACESSSRDGTRFEFTKENF